MLKFIKFFILLTVITACSTTVHKNSLDYEKNILKFGSPSKEELKKDENNKFEVSIKSLNYTESQKNKLNLASELIKKIFNSIEYKNEVINFTFKGEKKFHENKNKTNEEIYKHLIAGAEILIPAENDQMDLTVKMYYSWKSTVGYTYPTDMIVYTNSKFYNKFGPCDVASNIVHEWTHKMGYGHSKKWNKDRDFTVPYGHNTIIKNLCPLALENKLTPSLELR